MQAGKEKQAALYTLYHDKVFGYILNRLHDRNDAEDITSEVYLRLFSKSDGFDLDHNGASTYIFKVTQSVLADFHRKKKIVCTQLEDIAHFDEKDDLDDMLVHLNNALETLSEREKEIVILHYYDGLGHKEISKKMGLSYTNERQICHVAIKKLRKDIERRMDSPNTRKVPIGDESLKVVSGGLVETYGYSSLNTNEIDDAKNKGGCGSL